METISPRLPQCQLLHNGKMRHNRYTSFIVPIMQHTALRHWSVWPKPGNVPEQNCGKADMVSVQNIY